MVWQMVSDLHEIRGLLPGFDTPEGAEVLFWVLKSAAGPRPLKDLYRSSRFSEPTVRRCLMRLVDQGLVSIQVSDDDERQRYAEPTTKLKSAADAYRTLFMKAVVVFDPLHWSKLEAQNIGLQGPVQLGRGHAQGGQLGNRRSQ